MRPIDADIIIKNLTDMKNYYDSIALDGMIKALKEAPTIEAQLVVCGEWEKTSEYMPIYGCSVCKERNLFKNGDNVFSNFCPNCGAKMK